MRPFKHSSATKISIEDEFKTGSSILLSIEDHLEYYNAISMGNYDISLYNRYCSKYNIATESITEFICAIVEKIKILIKKFITWLKKVAAKIYAQFNLMGMKCRSLIKDLGSVNNYGDVELTSEILDNIKDKFNLLQEYIFTKNNKINLAPTIGVLMSCLPNKQSIKQCINGERLIGSVLEYDKLPKYNNSEIIYVSYVVGSNWKGLIKVNDKSSNFIDKLEYVEVTKSNNFKINNKYYTNKEAIGSILLRTDKELISIIKDMINNILSLEKELHEEIKDVLEDSNKEQDTITSRLKYSNKLSSVQIVGTRMLLDSCNMYFTTVKNILNVCDGIVSIIIESAASNYENMLKHYKEVKGCSSAELKYWNGDKRLPYIGLSSKDITNITGQDHLAYTNINDGPLFGCIIINTDKLNENTKSIYTETKEKITPNKDVIVNTFTNQLLNIYLERSAYIKNIGKEFYVTNDKVSSNVKIVLDGNKCYFSLKDKIVGAIVFLNDLIETFKPGTIDPGSSSATYNMALSSIENIMALLNNSVEPTSITKKELDFIYYHEYAHSVLYQSGVFDNYTSSNSTEVDRHGSYKVKYINDELELQADAYAMLKTNMSMNELINVRFNILANHAKSVNIPYLNNYNIAEYTRNIKKQLPIVKKLTNLSLLESITYIRNRF